MTWRLWTHCSSRASGRGSGTRVYELVDRPLIPVVAQMERARDQGRPRRSSRGSRRRIRRGDRARSRTRSTRRPAQPFTIGSPQQLGADPVREDGPQGRHARARAAQYSTDQSVLERLAGRGRGDRRTRCSTGASSPSCASTYTEALQAAINPRHRPRPHQLFSLVGAQTGRLSSTDPNLQNIPIRTDIGRQIREAFVRRAGQCPARRRLQPDRAAARRAHGRRAAAEARRSPRGEDIHAAHRARRCSATVEPRHARPRQDDQLRDPLRHLALGPRRRGSAIEPDEAQAMIDRYFERFPGIQRYIHDTLESVPRATAISQTLFGRKTWFPRINAQAIQHERAGRRARGDQRADPGHQRRHHQARDGAHGAGAVPTPGCGHVKMLLQVHDELVFELPEGDVAAASPIIERVMAEARCAVGHARRAAGDRDRHRRQLGRRALSLARPHWITRLGGRRDLGTAICRGGGDRRRARGPPGLLRDPAPRRPAARRRRPTRWWSSALRQPTRWALVAVALSLARRGQRAARPISGTSGRAAS